MEERWCFTDWKLDLRPRMLQKSRVKVLEEVSRYLRSSAEGQSDLGTFVALSPDGDPDAGCGEAIFPNNLDSLSRQEDTWKDIRSRQKGSRRSALLLWRMIARVDRQTSLHFF